MFTPNDHQEVENCLHTDTDLLKQLMHAKYICILSKSASYKIQCNFITEDIANYIFCPVVETEYRVLLNVLIFQKAISCMVMFI